MDKAGRAGGLVAVFSRCALRESHLQIPPIRQNSVGAGDLLDDVDELVVVCLIEFLGRAQVLDAAVMRSEGEPVLVEVELVDDRTRVLDRDLSRVKRLVVFRRIANVIPRARHVLAVVDESFDERQLGARVVDR
jgi:hypothetical protein